MICSVYQVKLSHGAFDGTAVLQPDATFDESKGYSVGFVLLVVDGTTWKCTDASADAAVWVQDDSQDSAIYAGCVALTESATRYLDNLFISNVPRYRGTVAWTKPDEILMVDGGFDALGGDTILVSGASRNDGWYDVQDNTLDVLTVLPAFTAESEDSGVWVIICIFPHGLQTICAKMVAYDIWERPGQGSGVSDESIGTYSWTRGPVTAGYPAELVSGLMVYKRPKIR